MKTLLIIVISFLFYTLGFAQEEIERQVIASSGGYGEDSTTGLSASWTMGESFVETLVNEDADIVLTQGFQQGDTTTIVATKEVIKELGVQIYPNPVSQTLYIRLDEAMETPLNIRLTDMTGKVISEGIMAGSQHEVAMQDLPSAMYLLILSDGKETYTRKVIKTPSR